VSDGEIAEPDIDLATDVPRGARMWNHLLGGEENHPVGPARSR
jgi:hypothetical protein